MKKLLIVPVALMALYGAFALYKNHLKDYFFSGQGAQNEYEQIISRALPAGYAIACSTLGDIDNDGTNEFVVSAAASGERAYFAVTAGNAPAPSGSHEARRLCSLPDTFPGISLNDSRIVVNNLDNKGMAELIIETERKYEGGKSHAVELLFNDGNFYKTSDDAFIGGRLGVVMDIDGDGYNEIVILNGISPPFVRNWDGKRLVQNEMCEQILRGIKEEMEAALASYRSGRKAEKAVRKFNGKYGAEISNAALATIPFLDPNSYQIFSYEDLREMALQEDDASERPRAYAYGKAIEALFDEYPLVRAVIAAVPRQEFMDYVTAPTGQRVKVWSQEHPWGLRRMDNGMWENVPRLYHPSGEPYSKKDYSRVIHDAGGHPLAILEDREKPMTTAPDQSRQDFEELMRGADQRGRQAAEGARQGAERATEAARQAGERLMGILTPKKDEK